MQELVASVQVSQVSTTWIKSDVINSVDIFGLYLYTAIYVQEPILGHFFMYYIKAPVCKIL